MSIILNLRSVAFLFTFAFLWLATVYTSPLEAQDAEKRELKSDTKGLGSQSAHHSADGKLRAELIKLYGNDGPGSLIKIWTVGEQQLLHTFRVPGTAHAVAFSPDSETVVTADGVGNLGWVSTIREWDLAEGTERRIGRCSSEVGELRFSPDGEQLAAVAKFPAYILRYPLNLALREETKIACASQIKVWRLTGEENMVSINIPHPLGEWVERWPRIGGWGTQRIEAAFRKVVPTRLRFSADGKRLISETDAGFRTDYDVKSGSTLRHSGMSTAGVFKSMLMLGLHEVPSGVTKLVLQLPPAESPVHVSRRTDGWWQVGKAHDYVFKMDGETFVSRVNDVVKKEDIQTVLGLKAGTNLAELEAVQHPLGVLKITRRKTGIDFQLKEEEVETGSGETLQSGEVRWVTSVNDR